MLGLDETATDGDILMAVQEVLERSAQGARSLETDVVGARLSSDEQPLSDLEGESRVEKIRARVRQLNEQYGHEITPMAMFDLIMSEFTRHGSRGD